MALMSSSKVRQAVAEHVVFHHRLWLRRAIVLGVFAMAAALGLLAATRNPLFAVAAASLPLALVLLQVTLPRRELVPMIILFTAVFVPLSLPTGTGSRLVLSLVVTTLFVGLWILRSVTTEKRFQLLPTPVNKPLLGFMLVTLISLVWSNVFRDPFVTIWRTFPFVQVAAALVMIMLPGAFLLAANHLHDLKWLKAMAMIMLAAGALGLIKDFIWNGLPVNTRGMFAMWVISLSIALVLFHRRMHRAVRGLLALLAAGWVYWGFDLRISWLAGWLPGMVALGVLCFRRSKKLFLLLVIALALLIATNSEYYLGKELNRESQESGVTRLAAWKMSWRITGEHLLFGTGPAGYAVYYMSYFPDQGMATHSNYIDILSQTGIAGFSLIVWFFVGLAWSGYKLCLRLKGRGDFVEALANSAFAGTIACIVIMGFGDWLIPFAYTQTIAGFDYAVYNWLFMGTIIALERLTKHEDTFSATHA